jgi:hypothetical protein
MAVMMPKEKWTDDRLDDLNKKIGDGLARLDADVRELRGEMNARFETLDSKFDKKFDRLAWGMVASTVTIIAALIGPNVRSE